VTVVEADEARRDMFIVGYRRRLPNPLPVVHRPRGGKPTRQMHGCSQPAPDCFHRLDFIPRTEPMPADATCSPPVSPGAPPPGLRQDGTTEDRRDSGSSGLLEPLRK
jgi:hypothetical protein